MTKAITKEVIPRKHQDKKIFNCANCGYSWRQKQPGKEPKECPNCKSRRWRG